MSFKNAEKKDSMIITILLAGGRGHRASSRTPKQYLKVHEKSILQWSSEAFLSHHSIHKIQPVIHKEDNNLFTQSMGIQSSKILPPIMGGPERYHSVFAALESLEGINPSYVLIHDGARPAVSLPLLNRILNALHPSCGIIPAIPVWDTLRRIAPDCLAIDVDREHLMLVQTPQAFPYHALKRAYEAYIQSCPFKASDDAAIFSWAGYQNTYVQGCPLNVKLTTHDDIDFLRKILL